jgi:hypothetical protein
MSEITSLLSTTKRLLKKHGLTYRDVAKSLKLSEPSIKRMFASSRMTVDRLAQIGALLGYSLAELAQEAVTDKQRITTLTPEQEALVVSDMKLLLTAVCALNHWALSDIIATYSVPEAECIRYLLQIDRLRLIELLPGNRIRLLVARDFDWLPDGPIRQFFRTRGQDDFLNSRFNKPGESISFVHGMFTDAAFSQIQSELQRLRKRFSELHEESLISPLSHRHGASMLLATRKSWEPVAFASLRRSS